MAKLCICRDFNDCQAKKAIEKRNPEHAEQVHKLVNGSKPQCGMCLPHTQAMIDAYRETGIVPALDTISQDDLAKAHQKLTERFSQESNPTELYKSRFRRIPIKAIENYGAKVTGENAPIVSQ